MKAVWLLLGVVAFGGCVKRVEGETTAPRRSPAYYPLRVGNRWVYQGRFLGVERTQTVEILRERDGFFEDNQGGKLTVARDGVRDDRRYLLRDPVSPGQTWSSQVSVSSVERYTVLSVGQPCDVAAGHFEDCAQVEVRNRVDSQTTLVNDLTFAAGVGLVRVEVFADSGGKRAPQTTMELKSYLVAVPKEAPASPR